MPLAVPDRCSWCEYKYLYVVGCDDDFAESSGRRHDRRVRRDASTIGKGSNLFHHNFDGGDDTFYCSSSMTSSTRPLHSQLPWMIVVLVVGPTRDAATHIGESGVPDIHTMQIRQ